ncbi:unnamed protein product [Polarella glacialis]|uniref:Hexosyltransferase n=1 Tax=Polarella glacialis TaxID=89957 RepID=A0A813JAL7_POLGL|nr:unnamed protein product [Polarella glacialis]
MNGIQAAGSWTAWQLFFGLRLMKPLQIAAVVATFAANCVQAVPRESPDFDPEAHVPDMSESESVAPEDRRESEIGCHWTSRLKFSICDASGECHDAEILAFDFQRRAWSYYESNRSHPEGPEGAVGRALAPPLEESFWITSMPKEDMLGAFELCPGLVVTAFFLVAEAQLTALGQLPGQPSALDTAKAYMHFLHAQSLIEYQVMEEMWPVVEARERADKARAAAADRTSRPSVDIVIARCRTSLHWLWELPLPPQARLLIYEKCEVPEGELEKQLSGVAGKVATVLRVPALDSGEWMSGECGAYLQHILTAVRGAREETELADFTVFIHDDAPRHLKPEFLGLVFHALASGTYDVPFLNLAHERYLQMATPCLKQLYSQVFGRELQGRLSTYCCGHFVVGAARIRATPQGQFERLWQAVSQGSYTALAGGQCEVANMPCYVVEHIWHVLFGEEGIAPWRSEDVRLPLRFRYEGGRDTMLPSPLKLSPYMHRMAR